jgi:DmsE family decaheme c-type cytochrome
MRSIERLLLALMLCSSLGAARKFSDAWVGSQTCEPCHEELFNNVMKTPHGLAEKGIGAGPRGEWKEHVCESCHGPGAKHAGSADPALITNPAKLRSSQADQTCLGCHMGDETHTGRISGTHAKQGISCLACHQVHADGGHALVTRTNEAVNAQCSACHRNAWASFQKPSGHRLAMNAMNCVDCHNPHGETRATVNEPTCFRCHGDKRGPFTFEHAPIRLEGCGACHQPHGSVNPRLLTRHEVRLVCLECHANPPGPNAINAAMGVVPPSFHDLRSPRYQNCTVCHQSVHGSYTDRNLIR